MQLVHVQKKRIEGHDVHYILIQKDPTYNGNSIQRIVFDQWYQRNLHYIRKDTPLCTVILDNRLESKILSPINGFLLKKSVLDDTLNELEVVCSIHASRESIEKDDFTINNQDNLKSEREVDFIINKKEYIPTLQSIEEEVTISEDEYSKESLVEYFKLGLGTYLESNLDLPAEQISWLNQMAFPDSNFLMNEQLMLQTAKLYVFYVNTLNEHYKTKGTSIYEIIRNQMIEMKGLYVEQKRNSYFYGFNNKFDPNAVHSGLMTEIFNIAELSLKIHYRHGKSNTLMLNSSKISDFFPTVSFEIIHTVNQTFLAQLEKAEVETLLFLNEKNKTRWKYDYDEIKRNFSTDPARYCSKLKKLIALNSENKSQRLIYFESVSLLADHFPGLSLFHYAIYAKEAEQLGTAVKNLPKKAARKVFRTKEIQSAYYELISSVSTRFAVLKLEDKIADLLTVKRKEIILNKTDIKTIHHQQSEVVDKLNKILEEESSEISNQEQNIAPASNLDSIFENEETELSEITFSENHIELFRLFVNEKFEVNKKKMNTFASKINRFASGIVNEINELAFDALEEELILEEENGFTIENIHHPIVKQFASNEIE